MSRPSNAKRLIPGALLALVLFSSLVGCATVPKVTDPSGVDITVGQMSSSQIHSYYGTGSPGDLNPFVPPGGFLSPQTQDFIVLRITVAAARQADVSLVQAEADSSAGKEVARLYTWPQFESLLQDYYQQGREYQQVYNRARNAYMSHFDVNVSPGRYTYIVVLVGKHPLPLPVTVDAELRVGLGSPRIFKLTVDKVK